MNRTVFTRAAFGLGLLLCGFLQPPLRAQELDPLTSGSTYVIAFPDTVRNAYDSRFLKRLNDTVALILYSGVNNVVTITSKNGYERTVTAKGGKFEIIYLTAYEKPAKDPFATEIGVAAWNTFRVEAMRPIILYCYVSTKFGTEAFTPLPVESWGREYFAASHPGEVAADEYPGGETTYRSKNLMAPSQMVITSAFDSTVIQIYPSSRTQLIGKPSLVVTLKANQCYLLETFVDTLSANQGKVQSEIAGTRIISNKPISVISGNTRAQINPNEQAGLARNSFKNLCIEALAPVEQHGREFVYLPTWDTRRITGAVGERTQDKRASEFVRIYGEDSVTTTVVHDSGGGTVGLANVYQDRRWLPRARAYHTSNRSQAFMTSTATVIFNGTTGSVGFLGASYGAYGPYMVELVPREQWTSFAPYYAPTNPPGMEHFVNIVADTASARRIFDEDGRQVQFNNGTVPGTDLVWGSMAVAPGLTHYFVGRDGARFYAFAYGLWKGYELYRPGRAEKKDGALGLAGGGRDDGNHLLHPSEYEEDIAQSYGYPLAPRRVSLLQKDSLVIETRVSCASLHCSVRTANANPLGLRTIYLDSVSTRSDIIASSRKWQTDLIGASTTEFDVVLRNGAPGDSGGVIIQDRSGQILRIPFFFTSSHVSFYEGSSMRLINTRIIDTRDTVAVITNPSFTPLTIDNIALTGTPSGFRLLGQSPVYPITILPGKTLHVPIRFEPLGVIATFRDTLIVTSACGTVRLALVAEAEYPGGASNNRFAGYSIGQVHPSPTQESSVISFRLGRAGDLALGVYNIRGEIVTDIHCNGLPEGDGSVALDVSMYPPGTYLLFLSSGGWMASTSLVVTR